MRTDSTTSPGECAPAGTPLEVRAAALLAVAGIGAVALVYSPRFPQAFGDAKLLTAGTLVALVVLLPALLLHAARGRALAWPARASLIAILVVAGAVVCALPRVGNPFEAAKVLPTFLAGLTVCAISLLTAALWPAACRRAVVLLAPIALAASVVGLAQRFGFDLIGIVVDEDTSQYAGMFVTSTFGSGGYAARWLVPAALLLAGTSFAFSMPWRVVLLAISALAALLTLLTQSRAGFLSLASGIAILVVFAVRPLLRLPHANRRPIILTAAGLAVVLTGAAWWGGTIDRFILKERSPQALSTNYRYYLYRDTLGLIRERPLLGVGLAQFPDQIDLRASRELRRAQPATAGDQRINSAHNDYLEVFAEHGLAGFLPFALIVMAAASGAVRLLRRRDPSTAGLGAAAGGLVIFMGLDYPLHSPASAMLGWWVLGSVIGLGWGSGAPPAALPSVGVRLASLAAGVFLLLPAAFAQQAVVQYALSQQSLRHGLAASGGGRPDLARRWYEHAAQTAPDNREIYPRLAAACRALGDFPGAEAAAREWIRLDPHFSAAHNALGVALYAQPGRREEARAAFREAFLRNRRNQQAILNLAFLAYEDDLFALVCDYYELANAIEPYTASERGEIMIDSLIRTGRIRDADAVIRDYLLLRPDKPIFQRQAARIRTLMNVQSGRD